jgi:hypothetical protein
MTAITIAVTIAKFLRSLNPPGPILSDVVRKLQPFRINDQKSVMASTPQPEGPRHPHNGEAA